MKPSVKLMRPALIFLAVPLLISCQTPSKASSSTIEWTAEEVRDLERNAVCRALQPMKVSRASFDASPEDVKMALAGGAAAWAETCQAE